uniref:Ig-like domain-containing protein n=1 Tax=Erpetoichthys calabaricus TaxID=27687 RepID=A0A8C4RHT5_ERPCA
MDVTEFLISLSSKYFFCNQTALPVLFKQELKDQEAQEGDKLVLHCELSKPNVSVKWKKGDVILQDSKKLQIKSKGNIEELVIDKLELEDAAVYTCDIGDKQSSAQITIKGRKNIGVCFKLQDDKANHPSSDLFSLNQSHRKWKPLLTLK